MRGTDSKFSFGTFLGLLAVVVIPIGGLALLAAAASGPDLPPRKRGRIKRGRRIAGVVD